jgi:nucleoid-associated protein YgaU
LQNLHIEDNKLLVRGLAPSQDAINRVWDQIKLTNPNPDDLIVDLKVDPTRVQQTQAQAKTGQSYTVKSGDTLSKISKQFYGDPNEYMQIFYANRDKLNDPDKIQVGQQLVIPPKG